MFKHIRRFKQHSIMCSELAICIAVYADAESAIKPSKLSQLTWELNEHTEHVCLSYPSKKPTRGGVGIRRGVPVRLIYDFLKSFRKYGSFIRLIQHLIWKCMVNVCDECFDMSFQMVC